MSDIVKRTEAVQTALDKYRDKPFKWGEADCLHVTRTIMLALSHKTPPRIPRYSSEKTAIRRLKEAGYDSFELLIQDYALPLPVTFRLPGDIGLVSGHCALPAIGIYAGNNSWLGWSEEHPFFRAHLLNPDRLYRV